MLVIQQICEQIGFRLQPKHGAMQTELLSQIERLKQENAALRAQQHTRLQLFEAAVHDLRQPMQAVMLFSDALADEVCTPNQQLAAVRLQHSLQALERLSTGMLDLTRMEQHELAPCHDELALAPLLKEVDRTFEPMARLRGLRLVVRPTELSVRGDAVVLGRVLDNLVRSALHNTQKGGVLVGVRKESSGVRIDVCDTGEGLSRGMTHRVMPEAETARACSDSASELGLATVSQLASLLGARIGLRSTQGRGTVVSIHWAQA